MSIKSVKMKISKKKNVFLSHVPIGSLNPKIRFLGQKKCSVANRHRHTDAHESDYCGHPFRVSEVFPSTYQQGSAQKPTLKGGYIIYNHQSSIKITWNKTMNPIFPGETRSDFYLYS